MRNDWLTLRNEESFSKFKEVDGKYTAKFIIKPDIDIEKLKVEVRETTACFGNVIQLEISYLEGSFNYFTSTTLPKDAATEKVKAVLTDEGLVVEVEKKRKAREK